MNTTPEAEIEPALRAILRLPHLRSIHVGQARQLGIINDVTPWQTLVAVANRLEQQGLARAVRVPDGTLFIEAGPALPANGRNK